MYAYSRSHVNKGRIKRQKVCFITALVLLITSPIIAEVLDKSLYGLFNGFQFSYSFDYVHCLQMLQISKHRQRLVLAASFLLFIAIFSLLYRIQPDIGDAAVMTVAKGIQIPASAGNGQYGTSRFMTQKEFDKCFKKVSYTGREKIRKLRNNTGMIVDYERHGKKEIIHYLTEPVNAIVLGATRSGKTRRTLLTSTWLDILAGVNLLVVDVKGEIFAFTNKFAKANGYEVRTLDFRFPEKSEHFNNMAEISQLLKEGNVTKAVNKAWDIVTVLVGETHGERIWNDGQCATIAAAILIVAQDAPEHCRNLTNVYYFLAYMCEADPESGEMAVTDYLNNLPSNHPARGAFQIAQIAPFRTRSSFFTSALATLRLFTDWNVADVTSKSDYFLSDIDEKKVITYLILPDEKTTFHPLGAIYMKQLYESLVEQSVKSGGKLKRRFIFRADEIGNFPVIPGLGTMLSAGAGRNIFFELILQDYQQLEGKYKDDFRNIKTNCQLTLVLKATDPQTTKELSQQLDNYTTLAGSVSSSVNDGGNHSMNISSSRNLIGRPLLFPGEIADLEKPDALLLYGGKKAIVNLPDLSEYHANKIFGMGNEDFNQTLYLKRMSEREERSIAAPRLWGIWEEYGASGAEDAEDRVTFL